MGPASGLDGRDVHKIDNVRPPHAWVAREDERRWGAVLVANEVLRVIDDDDAVRGVLGHACAERVLHALLLDALAICLPAANAASAAPFLLGFGLRGADQGSGTKTSDRA